MCVYTESEEIFTQIPHYLIFLYVPVLWISNVLVSTHLYNSHLLCSNYSFTYNIQINTFVNYTEQPTFYMVIYFSKICPPIYH